MVREMIRPRTHLPAVAAATLTLALAATVLAGCGEKKESLNAVAPESIDLVLDFYVNPDHAGIFTAQEQGYFKRGGLDVRTHVPSDPSAPLKEVAAGRADLAISYEPEVLLAREQGLDVKVVASLVHEPLTSLISLPAAAISGPASLKGKTVATAGIPYQADYLDTILARGGLSAGDVQQVNVGFNLLPALLSGRADAILGGYRNIEGVDLAERGENPVITPVNELGVPNYDELVLVADPNAVKDNPKPIELFLDALSHGTRDAARSPALATQAILKAGQGLDPKLTRAEVDATVPLLQRQKGRQFGYLDQAQWEAFAGWMADRGLISQIGDIGSLIDNGLLPPRRG